MNWVGAMLLSTVATAQSAPNPPNPPRMVYGTEILQPVVPPEFRPIITEATPDKLTVRSLDGRSIPIDISGFNPWDYRLFLKGRYLGIRLSGYEVVGYLLIDRAARDNNVIETGRAPLFSADGRWFAVAGITDADQGNFEGVGLWEVNPTSSTRRFFTNAVPLSSGWRADGWIGDCFGLSAFTNEGAGYYPPEKPEKPEKRHNYGLWVKPDISLQQTGTDPPCDKSKRL